MDISISKSSGKSDMGDLQMNVELRDTDTPLTGMRKRLELNRRSTLMTKINEDEEYNTKRSKKQEDEELAIVDSDEKQKDKKERKVKKPSLL